MSSANLVEVIYTPEAVYGVTDEPLSGAVAETTRFTSETLSGSPTTSVSASIRTDRMSGGQVVTGLDVGGDLNTEVASSNFQDDFFEAGMMSTWVPAASLSTTLTLTPNPTDDQEAELVITGDLSAIGPGVAPNDVLQIVPASGPVVTVTVITVDSTTNATVATKAGELAISGLTMDLQIAEYLVIGAEQRSFTISKAYLDVLHLLTTDEHSQRYNGSLVSGFNVSATYGEISSGVFTTVANGYVQEEPSYSQQIEAAGGTVNPAATSAPLNASIDVPIITADGEAISWCVESFDLTLDNGLDPSTCIGSIAPQGYTLGTASIVVNMSSYLSDSAYDSLMAQKLTQAPIAMTLTMTAASGGYAFFMPALQLTFPDPTSDGQNEQTMLDATGTAKVGANGESSLKLYKLIGDQP
jgi:hypothetical protein